MLVGVKEMEDVSRGIGGGSTAFLWPEQCVEIVRFVLGCQTIRLWRSGIICAGR